MAEQIDEAALSEMYGVARVAIDSGFTRVEIDPLHLAEIIDRLLARLVLPPAEPQPDAPTDIALLPDYWDERRRRQGKPDLSRCAAELRIALRAKGELAPTFEELHAHYRDACRMLAEQRAWVEQLAAQFQAEADECRTIARSHSKDGRDVVAEGLLGEARALLGVAAKLRARAKGGER